MGKWADRVAGIAAAAVQMAPTTRAKEENWTPSIRPNDQTTKGVEQARQYAPDRPCLGCALRMWWQRPDGAWICANCPDPIKCRWCDRPDYSHKAWPMVCARWEPKSIPQGLADVKPLDAA